MKAYCLWAMGYSDSEMLRHFRSDPSPMVAGKWRVKRNEVHTYFTDEFWHNLSIYQSFKTMGLPFDCGWAEHPKDIVALIRIFSQAEVMYANQKTLEAKKAQQTMRKR